MRTRFEVSVFNRSTVLFRSTVFVFSFSVPYFYFWVR